MAGKFDNCRQLLIGILFATIALATVAFDGVLLAEGSAFEWIDAPLDCDGDVFVDSSTPPSMQLQPVAGVHIRFKTVALPRRTIEKTATDSEGHFSTARTVAAGTYNIVVAAEKEGFRPVTRTFRFGGGDPKHIINVVLVRTTQVSGCPDPNEPSPEQQTL